MAAGLLLGDAAAAPHRRLSAAPCISAAGPRGPTTAAASPAGAAMRWPRFSRASASGGCVGGWEEEARRPAGEGGAEELQSRASPDDESQEEQRQLHKVPTPHSHKISKEAGRKEGDGEADVRFGAKGYKRVMYSRSVEFLEAALFLPICGRILRIVGLLGTISLTSYFNSN